MSNYSEEMTQILINTYQDDPSRNTVEKLAAEYNRSLKSIIGKLSREGVYQRESYKTKAGEKPITKIELVHMIAERLDVSPDELFGLDKAPKQALQFLKTHL
jgi:hypothetical protein